MSKHLPWVKDAFAHESSSKKTLYSDIFGGFAFAVLQVLTLRGNKKADRSEDMYCPRNSKCHSEKSIVSAFFLARPVNVLARYNGPGARYNGPGPAKLWRGLGSRQEPERHSTRSIVAFERYSTRVLPAIIAELCFQVFSDLISERSRSSYFGTTNTPRSKIVSCKQKQFCDG